MKRTIHYLVLSLFLLSGCVHEYPEGEGTDPTFLTVEVALTLHLEWEAYRSRSKAAVHAADNHVRRFIIEVRGEGKTVHRQTVIPDDFAKGQTGFLLPETLHLHAREYTVAVWTDYTEAGSEDGLYYDATDLNNITIREPYTGNTDYRDCHYATIPLDLRPYRDQWNAHVRLDVDMKRPLAKYHLVATDVERYLQLQAIGNYPPVEELTATIIYEGFVPSSFNMATGSPNDAVTGVSYAKSLPVLPDGTDSVQLGSDLIWVNGGDTFVTVTVQIADTRGNVVSRIPGVRVDYRRGFLTTVSGNFLTAGKTGGGIHVDTEWKDDIIIEF